jgi:hypothetical protein
MPLSFPIDLPGNIPYQPSKVGEVNMVSMSRSNFNGIRQVQEWPGEWWEVDVTLAAMKRSVAAQWIALLSPLCAARVGPCTSEIPTGRLPQGAGGSSN